MQSAKRILFYVDVKSLGGHEVMCLAACDAIREFFPLVEIEWLVSDDNPRLLELLTVRNYKFDFHLSLPRERLVKHPFAVLRAVVENSIKIRRLAPDIVVVAAPAVTLSFMASLATRLSGVPYVCYLATAALAGELLGDSEPAFIDAIWRFCFRHIPNLLTIDDEQKRRMLAFNPRARIEVVENFVPKATGPRRTRDEAREELGIYSDHPVIGVVGRVSFPAKNQGWLVEQLASNPFWEDYLVLFAGDGPDFGRLSRMVEEHKLEGRVKLAGWIEDVNKIYPALDLLLIPSRTEAVPLVMLEALSQGVPVASSNVGGMKEWLPEDWRFDVNDGAGMTRAVLTALRGGDEPFWGETRRHLDRINDRKRLASEFLEAVLSFE